MVRWRARVGRRWSALLCSLGRGRGPLPGLSAIEVVRRGTERHGQEMMPLDFFAVTA